MTKEQLFSAALALNGEDKKYSISVEGDKIITRVKWMDAEFFSPDAVTDEMKEFEYVVQVDDKGKYCESDKSVSVKKSAGAGGASYNKQVFVGKQISYNKTIGFGKDNESGNVGAIDATFNSEEYKAPVRSLLKDSGYVKKKGAAGKIIIGAVAFLVIAIVAVVVLLSTILNKYSDKKPISVDDFESTAKEYGYILGKDEEFLKENPDVEDILIALDKENEYQIEFIVLEDKDTAKETFAFNKENLKELASESSSNISSSVNASKYSMYSVSTSDMYLYVARIDNTVVFATIDIEYKDKVKEFIKEIGY